MSPLKQVIELRPLVPIRIISIFSSEVNLPLIQFLAYPTIPSGYSGFSLLTDTSDSYARGSSNDGLPS